MLFLISLLSVLLALGVERHFLLDKFGFGTYPVVPIIFSAFQAVHPVIFVSGLVLMSIIAATQSMYTAKSLLLNIITSHLIPVPRFFHRRDSRRRKLITVGIVSLSTLPYLFINNVDYLLLIASCCMLAALIVINLSTTFCSALNFPSFHPGFRLFHSFIAIFGVASCTLLLFGCKLQIGVMVAIIVTIIYSAIAMRSKSLHPWMQHSVVIDIANMLLYSSTQKSAVRLIETFRSKPRCIVFMRFPAASDNLLQMAKILSQNRSALCISLIRDVGDHENTGYDDVYTARQCMNYIKLSGYATQFKYQKISSLHSIASALVSCCGLGVFKSNTVIIEYPAEAALKGRPDSLLYHYHVHRVCVQHCNLVVVKGFFPLKIEALQSNQTIDIWWIIDNGDVLLMVAKMLRKHKMWLQAKLRLFVVVDLKDDIEQIERELYLWLTDNHYLLDKIEFIRADVRFLFKSLVYFRLLPTFNLNNKVFEEFRERLPDGKPIQNAVDNGFRKSQMNSNLEEGERSLRPRELKIRAQQLNREIWQRSSEAALVLMNMPEPPKNLERFWKYLNFLNELSHKLKKVLFVRGVDITFSAESDTSTIRDWTD
ncbi:unnamed protein product [Thelazia callipaeda]|uniref:SLC12 domain-containing protein n=1 Tax=Thelazia callipaeda TaxID=103827 RepID=A0A0N5CKP7_THECL|nr:unnamed protein product [Thelazia callipaeda]